MEQIYCPTCEKLTQPEDLFTTEYSCGECGTVVQDSPMRDIGRSEMLACSRMDNHWSYSFRSTENWAAKELLSKEQSAAGESYRRKLVEKSSAGSVNIVASIESICAKLDLPENIKKSAMDKWHEVRGPFGLKGCTIHRKHSSLVGLACVYWICRAKDIKIDKNHFVKVAEIDKKSFLSVLFKLQQRLGTPDSHDSENNSYGDDRELGIDDEDLQRRLEEASSSYESVFHPLWIKDALLLAGIILRLRLCPVELLEPLLISSIFLLQRKYAKDRRLPESVDKFCKKFSLPLQRHSEEITQFLKSSLVELSQVGFGKSFSIGEVLSSVRELCDILSSFSSVDLEGRVHKFKI